MIYGTRGLGEGELQPKGCNIILYRVPVYTYIYVPNARNRKWRA